MINIIKKTIHDRFSLFDKYMHKKQAYASSAKRWTWSLIRSVFIIGFCFVIVYPLLNMISRAFMHPVDLFDNTILWVPKHFTLDNFNVVNFIMDYGEAFKNSLLMSVVTTILQTAVCMMVGYGFARFDFPFKKTLFALVLLTIIIPPQLIMVSIYLHFRFFDFFGLIQAVTGKNGMNMMDTLAPSILLSATGMGIKNGLFIYIFRQFFRGMPKETEEAAFVDGAGSFKTFYFIMAPGALTAMVTVILFSFVWQWNDIFYSGMFLKELKVLPATYSILANMMPDLIVKVSPEMAKYDLWNPVIRSNLRSTGVLMMIVPLIVLYMFAQKYFVESIESAGIVG